MPSARATPQDHAEAITAGDAEQAAGEDYFDEGQHGVPEGEIALAGEDEFKYQHGEQCTHRIDDDAFPAQNIGDMCIRSYSAQHWHYHSRSGDYHDRAEQECQFPGKPHKPASGEGGDELGDQDAADQAPHNAFRTFDLVDLQSQAAFEQNHCHRQGDEGK